MKRRKVITVFSIIMFFCMVFSTVISLFSTRQISKEHTEEFLQVLSNDIYHSIIDELTDTVNNAKVVANDSLLIDLLERETQVDQSEIEDKLTAYTTLLEQKFSYSWVFIVSEQSKAYYSDTGIYRMIDPENNEDDAWYADFLATNKDSYISIGRDNDVPDTWTVFVDAKIENEAGDLLGVCGMALELTDLQERIRNYEEEYDIQIFFVDQDINTQLGSGSSPDEPEQTPLQTSLDKDDQTTRENVGPNTNYTITKYIQQLDWYMVVENINPYDYTVDYMMIGINLITFLIFFILAVVSLHLISKRTGTLYTDTYQDDLTGLFNRRAFEENMNKLRKQDIAHKLILAVFDINSLKYTNDSIGHSAGDELIEAGAQLIHQTFSPYGKCYRVGGDEFVAILDKPIEDIQLLISQFEQNVSQWHGKQAGHINISCGIADAADQFVTVDELLSLADERMYHNKAEYYQKNRIERRKE